MFGYLDDNGILMLKLIKHQLFTGYSVPQILELELVYIHINFFYTDSHKTNFLNVLL